MTHVSMIARDRPTRPLERGACARPAVVALLLTLGALSGACGGSGPSPTAPPQSNTPPTASASTPARASSPVPPGHLARGAVVDTLSRGFGAFLARLQIEPALTEGRFHGWRIVGFAEGDPLAQAGLSPGDVVTSVNARPIERPEQALACFQSLAVASELRIAYERKGVAREAVF